MKTVDQIIAELRVFTSEQRSIAWSPEPPHESVPGDCRPGGNCGLDFNFSTRRARWVQARYRLKRDAPSIKISCQHDDWDHGDVCKCGQVCPIERTA